MRFVWMFLVMLPSLASAQARASLRGSAKALEEQNTVADREHLSRIKDVETLEKFARLGLLVRIPDGTSGLRVDPRLEDERRYCRPWTVAFLKDLGSRFQKKFGKPLYVNSCTRDVETQEELRHRNGNAAATSGPHASSHLTGATVDIRRLGLTGAEQDFVRSRLLFHEKARHIEATEEKKQAVWHVMVYKTYVDKKKPRSKK